MMGKQSLFQIPHRAFRWQHWIFGIAALLLLAACDRPRGGQMTAEGDEPHFRRGRQLLASNKPAALEAFQKVIDKRGGDAPESHLEVGRIYLDHFKDYVAAIYHFRRYNELRPNGSYATQVAQMIETAEKEYTRKLAGNPLEAQNDRIDLLDKIDVLKAENATLVAQINELTRGGRGNVATNPPPPTGNNSRTNPPAPVNAPNVVPAPTPTTGWTNALPEGTPAPNVLPVAANPAPAGNAVAMTPIDPSSRYVVQKGDTLVAISRKVYGSASHWKAIYEANRDRIPDPNGLKIGTELRMP